MPLYRSAEISRSLGKPNEAIATYQKIIERYPSFHKAPEAKFMLAFSYDEDLKDINKARVDSATRPLTLTDRFKYVGAVGLRQHLPGVTTLIREFTPGVVR